MKKAKTWLLAAFVTLFAVCIFACNNAVEEPERTTIGSSDTIVIHNPQHTQRTVVIMTVIDSTYECKECPEIDAIPHPE